MANKISVTVNGKQCAGEVESRTLLSDYLREDLSLTGTHIGCDTSSCGACTVHVDGKAVEGLSTNGNLHPIQEGFKEEHGLQCGFCTPGMMMTATDFLKTNPNPTEHEIREALEGNFCRCTGYHNIVKSIQFIQN